MARRPTDRQRELLVAIADSLRDDGRPPTLRELSEQLGVSPNAVLDRLRGLEERGLVTREPRKSRAVRITGAGESELAGGVS